jgi:hypothetical protein
VKKRELVPMPSRAARKRIVRKAIPGVEANAGYA